MSRRKDIDTFVDHRDALQHFLVTAGTQGRKQSEITSCLQSYGDAAMLIGELEIWLTEDRVQKFILPPPASGGRSVTVWRATNKILDPEHE